MNEQDLFDFVRKIIERKASQPKQFPVIPVVMILSAALVASSFAIGKAALLLLVPLTIILIIAIVESC